jgi:hypothetical protein
MTVPIPICGQCVRAFEQATRLSRIGNTIAWVGGVALVVAGVALAAATKTTWPAIPG